MSANNENKDIPYLELVSLSQVCDPYNEEQVTLTTDDMWFLLQEVMISMTKQK